MPPQQSRGNPESSAVACRKDVARVAARPFGRGEGQPAHAGLLLARYLTVPARNKDAQYPEAKRTLLDSAVKATANAQPFYALAFERWKESLRPPAEARTLAVQGRLVTGLGNASVVETGIAVHHTYGVPWIPGSGLKGLAAHYADRVWGGREIEFDSIDESTLELALRHRRRYDRERDDRDFGRYSDDQKKLVGSYHRLLFGTTESGGLITFHDAWITPDSLGKKDTQGRPQEGLLRDVLTPHHRDYYKAMNELGSTAKDAKIDPPTDFDDPNPVSFLSVRGSFLVALSCDRLEADTDGQKSKSFVAIAWKILEEALATAGAGGKTSSGYGRMTPARPPS